MIRQGLVAAAVVLATGSYYSFHHFVHSPFHPPFNHTTDGNHTTEEHRHGPFQARYLHKDHLFLYYGMIPLVLIGLASLVWQQRSTSLWSRKGDVQSHKWSIVWGLVPLLWIFLDGSREHFRGGRAMEKSEMHWSYWNSILTSMMSPTGYAATWALAAFLIPVTPHAPLLTWLSVTPVQALAFHRIMGWTSLFFSVFHGFLHLRHLMDVLYRGKESVIWYHKLWTLCVPERFGQCLTSQNPWNVLWDGQQVSIHQEDRQCWLALINGTGVVSTVAFLVLGLTSLPIVRRYSYTLFYVVHIPMAWIMMITAIWHYPTCGLVMIPNIIYYLSLKIPVAVRQRWISTKAHGNDSLTEAKLIGDGVIELTFATSAQDEERHENRFVKVAIQNKYGSLVSHPFSIFSRYNLTDQMTVTKNTATILMRSAGPFSLAIKEALFPADEPNASSNQRPVLEIDSFYAGSFHWVHHAMKSHDEILLVAGGVGIVPFLEFLPALQRQIMMQSPSNDLMLNEIGDAARIGPDKIHLHWYCRDVGLASHVWTTYLKPYSTTTWEGHHACEGRLKIHVHLTRGDGSAFGYVENAVREERVFVRASDGDEDKPLIVQDTALMQSKWAGMGIAGSTLVVAMMFHWWWYKDVLVSAKYREDNLLIRSQALVLTIILGVVVSILGHWIILSQERQGYNRVLGVDDVASSPATNDTESYLLDPHPHPTVVYPEDTILTVTSGRPAAASVVQDIATAQSPGVYLCGPVSLMKSIESDSRKTFPSCAIYREDSEL